MQSSVIAFASVVGFVAGRQPVFAVEEGMIVFDLVSSFPAAISFAPFLLLTFLFHNQKIASFVNIQEHQFPSSFYIFLAW